MYVHGGTFLASNGMSAISWLVFGLLAAAALVLVGFFYRKRELPGRGRGLLAAFRWGVIALLLLLIFDPELPTAGLMGRAGGRQVIVDASLSMMLPERQGGESRWSRAVAQARRLAGGRSVLLFGDEVRAVHPDSLPAEPPIARASRLLPALQAASEAGVQRVTVLTDGGIDDAVEVSRWLPRLGIDIDYRMIGQPVRNAAIAEVEAPGWAEEGKPLEIRFGVIGAGFEDDSVDVRIEEAGEVRATQRIAVAEQGRVVTGALSFTPAAPSGGGLVRYDVRLESGDAMPDDDVRSVYVQVSDEPAGIVLISFRPDWEPRFLLPVLEQALGLPARGYLRTRDGEYAALGTGLDAGARGTEEDVRRAATGADLLVLHGAGERSPTWLSEVMGQARRMIVLPADGVAGVPIPVEVGGPVRGEWYADPDIPATPVAPLLAGLDVADSPPLPALRFAQIPAGAWAPMLSSRDRRGTPSPLVVAGETAGRRWAVALGEGYWRWAFREGASRQVYARLWGALAGWIMQEHGALAAAAVRPLAPVLARGEPLRWIAPGLAPDSIRVSLTDTAGGEPRDTVVAAQADTAIMPPLPPGHFAYEVEALAEGEVTGRAEGRITVESYSPDFTRSPVTLAALVTDNVPVGPDARRAPGRPLHASAWPYVLILLLLASEWVLRRRWGLR